MADNNNPKARPIPVVPRTLRIVNPDGTVTRGGQLLLEQIQAGVAGGGSGDGGGGGEDGPDAVGEVTGFSYQAEVGTRYASEPDRLVHMTVGFTPIMPVPQPVTYFVSADNGAHWTWIGWQRMKTVDQILKVDRLAPGEDSNWRVAAGAGTLGGDPSPIADADLNTLYPTVVRSPAFPVAGLSTPSAFQGITATIGPCSDVTAADGFTHYGRIEGVTYTDPLGGTDFFVRITVQIYGASGPLAAEQAHGGTQITGGVHLEEPLLITYVPGLTFVRYRFYTANRNSQGGGDFTDPSTNTLQQVRFNGSSTTADHYDVPITIPPFEPPDPGGSFNVLSVTASEVGPKYQDEKAGLHTTIGVTPVIDVDFSTPRTVTLWFDFGTGSPVWQGWYAMTAVGQVIRIGDSTLGTDGTRKSGDIWVPANTAQGNWKVYCGAGRIDDGMDATAYATFAFTVLPVTACLPNGTTNAHFLPAPDTGDPIIYNKWDPGIWYWEYYCLEWTPPSIATDPNYWFTLISVQKGATIGGVWTPAPDPEGINESPTLSWLGRNHAEVLQLPGLANDQLSVLTKFGTRPATWVIPPAQNKDLTPNPYREFRFLLYNVSRLGTDTSGSGGAGTYTLQTSCWPGGADHFILIPQPKTGDLDIRAANPETISLPLKGGDGHPLTVEPGSIGSTYLADDAVEARNMAANAITAANGALAAGAVVDINVHDVSIARVTYGTAIFAGDVVMSRGLGLPVIVLKNSGIYLFGQADSSSGASGLTSKPYVGVQNNAIGLFQGGTGTNANGGPDTGGSVFINAASSSITIYTKNGDLTQPYFTASSIGLSIVDGNYSVTIQATGINIADQSTPGVSRQILITSGGISITNNTNTLVITGSSLQLQLGGSPRVTIDNTNGIILSNGGTSSVQVSSSEVNIISSGSKFRVAANVLQLFAGSTVAVNITGSVPSIFLFDPATGVVGAQLLANSGGALSLQGVGGGGGASINCGSGNPTLSMGLNQVLTVRYAGAVSTLADAIAVLRWHGLCN